MHPPFPIDEATDPRIQDAYRFGSVGVWSDAPAAEPIAAQVEPLLGEDAEPDATFFVESWTVGVSAASESYIRRHQPTKHEPSAVPLSFSSFTFLPFFNMEPAPPVAAPAATNLSSSGSEPARDSSADKRGPEAAMDPAGPLTVESACRLLGIVATSTREEIKAAYRRMASRYHPDRLESAGAWNQKQASDRMAAINEAYRLLCAVRSDATI